MAWRTCQSCSGTGTVPNKDNGGGTKQCPACKGKGGADTLTTP